MKKEAQLKLFQEHLYDGDEELKEKYGRKRPKEHEVKVHTSLIAGKFPRNSWVKIESGKKKIYRIIKGTSVKNFNIGFAWLDYDSRKELDISSKKCENIELIINKANWFQSFVVAPFKQPNRVNRVQYQVSFIIAVLAIFLTLLSFIK